MHLWPTCLLAAALAAGVPAQCDKPLVPVGGLPTTHLRDRSFTYDDGYRTRYNLVYPSGSVPQCKWPLVVDIHGLGYQRLDGEETARRGFAVLSYDVRGQGDARTLNPATKGLDFYGAGEKYDLAEIIAHVRRRYKGLVSRDRLAVVGGSQGAIHAWFAAAYSGRRLTISGRGSVDFPRVAVAIPEDFVPDALLSTHPNEGTQWGMMYLHFLLSPTPPAAYEPAHLADLERFFLAQDPAGHRAHLLAQPGRAVLPLLQTSGVPVRFACGYYDELNPAREYVRTISQLSNPNIHGIVSTIGHGSANNYVEGALRRETRILWLDRYLWNVPNNAERVRRWTFGVVPASTAGYGDITGLWGHRDEAEPAPPALITEKLWLTAQGALDPAEPTGGAPTRIVHRVAPSFTPALFHRDGLQRLLPQVLAAMPMSERVFRYPPLVADVELAGTPRLGLSVKPDAARFVLAGTLRARFPGESGTFMISHWGQGVLDAAPGVPRRVEFDLSPAFIRLPRGTVLEVVVRNHWVQEAPMPDSLFAAPYFVDSTVEVEHGGGVRGSWLTVQRRPDPAVDLVSATTTLDVRNPDRFAMRVRGGAFRAGRTAWTFASMSGTAAGILLGGVEIPLAPDLVFDAFIQIAGTGLVSGFFARLDGDGEAAPAVNFQSMGTLPIDLIGRRLSFATFVLDDPRAFAGSASNALHLFLE